ncbi:hypothetical protein BgiBS90_005651 [Biomphalaria glabrata]|nr:hypothetical protein BgiBS90_005651 [Biomphalaria glabrata]
MANRISIGDAYNRFMLLNQMSVNTKENARENERKTADSHNSYLEREQNALKLENTKLRSELEELKSTLKQITCENSHEKFDERRINLMKFQTIQLERQISVLTEALGCRQESLYEVENVLLWQGNKLRSLIPKTSKGIVSLESTDLTQMLENLESSRIKLFKSLENSTKESAGKPLLLLNPFLGGKYRKEESISLLDISLQCMDYVNLRHVSKLESKLSILYKDLIQLQKALEINGIQGSIAEKKRLDSIILKTSVNIKDAADDLLSLSLLCPSAPWKELKRPLCKQVSVDRLMAALPPLPQCKREEVVHVLEACIRTCNHRHLLLQKKSEALKDELSFHRSVYDIQMQYTQDLIDAVRTGYKDFETSIQSVVCQSLQNLLESFSRLKKSASEEALKEFLLFIKENENQLASIVKMLSTEDSHHKDNGSTFVSQYGETFLTQVNDLINQCQQKRDESIHKNKKIQEQQSQLEEELCKLIEELEAKYDKQWILQSAKREKSNDTIQRGFVDEKHQNVSSSSQMPSETHLSDSTSHSDYIHETSNKGNSILIYDRSDIPKVTDLVYRKDTGCEKLHRSQHLNKIDRASPHNSGMLSVSETTQEKNRVAYSRNVKNRKPSVPLVAQRVLKLQRPKSLINLGSSKKERDSDNDV